MVKDIRPIPIAKYDVTYVFEFYKYIEFLLGSLLNRVFQHKGLK